MSDSAGSLTVSTEQSQPCCGRYFTNFVTRCTDTPPIGGKQYEMNRTRGMYSASSRRVRGGFAQRTSATHGALRKAFTHPTVIWLLAGEALGHEVECFAGDVVPGPRTD